MSARKRSFPLVWTGFSCRYFIVSFLITSTALAYMHLIFLTAANEAKLPRNPNDQEASRGSIRGTSTTTSPVEAMPNSSNTIPANLEDETKISPIPPPLPSPLPPLPVQPPPLRPPPPSPPLTPPVTPAVPAAEAAALPLVPTPTRIQQPPLLPQSANEVRRTLARGLDQWATNVLLGNSRNHKKDNSTSPEIPWTCATGGTRLVACDRPANDALRRVSVESSSTSSPVGSIGQYYEEYLKTLPSSPFPSIDSHPVDAAQIEALAKRAVRHAASSAPPSLILTAAAYNHLHLLLNWVVALNKTASTSPNASTPGWGVVCLDEALHAFLGSFPEEGAGGCYYSMSSVPKRYDAFTGVGFMKVTVIHALIRRGVSVLLMDTDAVPLAPSYSPIDLIPFLSPRSDQDGRLASVDIFASQSTMPEEASDEWGFSLNLGWIWFRGSSSPGSGSDVDRTCRLLDYTIRHMEHDSPRPRTQPERGDNPNDQISMNLVLWAAGLQWYHASTSTTASAAATAAKDRGSPPAARVLDFDWGIVTGRPKGASSSSSSSSSSSLAHKVAKVLQVDSMGDMVGLKVGISPPKATWRGPCNLGDPNFGGGGGGAPFLHNVHCDARNHEKVFAIQRAKVWHLHRDFTGCFTPSDERRKRFKAKRLQVAKGSSFDWLLWTVAVKGDMRGVKVKN
jgi:hypothetical protein